MAVGAFVVVGVGDLENRNNDSDDDSLQSDELSDEVRNAVGMRVGEVAAAGDGEAGVFCAGGAGGPLASGDVDFIVKSNVLCRFSTGSPKR